MARAKCCRLPGDPATLAQADTYQNKLYLQTSTLERGERYVFQTQPGIMDEHGNSQTKQGPVFIICRYILKRAASPFRETRGLMPSYDPSEGIWMAFYEPIDEGGRGGRWALR